MSGNTAFISYVLVPSGLTGGSYTQGIHCNYIKKIDLGTSNPLVQEVSINFSDANDFKFLSDDIANGTGYTVNKIYALVQIVDNTLFSTEADIKPDSVLWKRFDITNQVSGYTGSPSFLLTGVELTSVVFKVSFLQYNNPLIFESYDLDYLDYPSSSQTDELCFGDVTYFFGNVETQIKAEVYTTDISINLPLNEYNSTSNLSWDGSEKVYVSEVGLYDSNKNLVAIAKMNDPVAKDATISRTIVFALDF